KSILDKASDLGINLVDTAMAYGNAEEIIGMNNLNSFNVVSKFMPSQVYGSVESQLNNSLNKLKVSCLYGYLCHRPTDLLENPLEWEALNHLKEQQKIKKIGFSLNSVNELESLLNKDF